MTRFDVLVQRMDALRLKTRSRQIETKKILEDKMRLSHFGSLNIWVWKYGLLSQMLRGTNPDFWRQFWRDKPSHSGLHMKKSVLQGNLMNSYLSNFYFFFHLKLLFWGRTAYDTTRVGGGGCSQNFMKIGGKMYDL